jgi:hypothetical protein
MDKPFGGGGAFVPARYRTRRRLATELGDGSSMTSSTASKVETPLERRYS